MMPHVTTNFFISRTIAILILFSFSILILNTSTCYAENFANRNDVVNFINKFTTQHGGDPQELMQLFSQYESSPEIIKHISKPFETVSWGRYQKHFLSEKRIKGGAEFWKKHNTLLQQVATEYGIPIEMIVAIIGIESFYGQYIGQYPTLQALATLAFDYPQRHKFFTSELEQFLLLTREQKLDPLKIKGSYAGAMGAPQFIPSSYRSYGVDFDKTGSIDLINNTSHAIASVANYFKKHGWQTGQPVRHLASIKGKKYQSILNNGDKGIKPVLSLAQLNEYGILSSDDLAPNTIVSLISLDNGSNKQFWLGRNNFYVITRYNHSNNYAMAVYELSQAIAKQIKL